MFGNIRSLTFGLAAALLIPALARGADASQAGQHALKFEKAIVVKLDYLLFLPEDYAKNTDQKFPLILFLHGAGERGSDINKVKVHGPPKIVEKKKDFPFIVVSPQCPENSWWEPHEIIALLDDIQKNYRVDTDRVYLTGLSMGGYGTWEIAQRYANRFAAIAPICGAGNPVRVRGMRDLPIWIFHGEADPVVPVARSQEMYDALKKIGGNVKLTTYPGVGHDSWTQTYDNPELYKWFLSHKRSDRRAETKQP